MSEENVLPTGISLNKPKEQVQLNIILDEEVVNTTRCPKCDIVFEAILLTNNSRHSGKIIIRPQDTILWENSLPKDRVRSIKLLNENLTQKLDNHIVRHKND